MVLFNAATKELTAKIVYYGPGLCGKTTNLQHVYDTLPGDGRGKMLSLATQTDRTLFFDFLPIDLGTIRGMKTRIQLYTVPGQVFYDATRKLVLRGADAVVFVADSQAPALESNKESFQNLIVNLKDQGADLAKIPHVIQWNKRDTPNALPIEVLEREVNMFGVPTFPACAMRGEGVRETLTGVAKLVLKSLAERYGGGVVEEPQVALGGPPPPPPRPWWSPLGPWRSRNCQPGSCSRRSMRSRPRPIPSPTPPPRATCPTAAWSRCPWSSTRACSTARTPSKSS